MYISDKGVLSGEWLQPLIQNGYSVDPLRPELGECLSGEHHVFSDGSRGWTISNGKQQVGVAGKEVGEKAETMIHFSSVFMRFGGNLKLAKEIETLLWEHGGRPK